MRELRKAIEIPSLKAVKKKTIDQLTCIEFEVFTKSHPIKEEKGNILSTSLK